MREILFRGRRKDNGEWVDGHLLAFKAAQINPDRSFILPFASSVSVSLGAYTFGGFVEVDPATVGQYTGLVDKNGKKIFEGDVLKMHYFYEAGSLGGAYEAEETLDVVVAIKQYGVAFETLDHVTSGYLCDYLEDPEVNLEVIGNRWDNPELLEVEA